MALRTPDAKHCYFHLSPLFEEILKPANGILSVGYSGRRRRKMRALIQRVSQACVRIDGQTVGQIGAGLLALIAAGPHDAQEDVHLLARKIAHLRIFADAEGKFNRSLLDIKGQILVVSQFTLYADCRKGRRPSFVGAAPAEQAADLVEHMVRALRAQGVSEVQTGRFGAMMQVSLTNDGPVTIWLDSEELRK